MNTQIEGARGWLALAGVMVFAFVMSLNAQVQTTTNTSSGASTHEVSVQRGEVVRVSGNDLVVKMEDGSLRDFHNVAESARVTVDGRKLGIHELTPGMKLEKTLTIVTTLQTITTVKAVTGKVFHVTPPNSVVLTLEDGTNEQFKIPKGQKFTINGEETDAFGLKKGMIVTATKIIEEPTTVVEHQTQLTGSMPPPPPAPPAEAPILIAVATPAPAQAAALAEELPKTAGVFPLIGLLGVLSLALSFGLRVIRSTF
jgi:RNase P/RNase MRP subunit p29